MSPLLAILVAATTAPPDLGLTAGIIVERADAIGEIRLSHREARRLAEAVLVAADAAGVPPTLALAVAELESGWDHHAVSRAGCRGLFQLQPRTARDVARGLGMRRHALDDPWHSARIGLTYLRTLYDRYGRWNLALAAYNMGSGRLRARRMRVNWYPGSVLRRRDEIRAELVSAGACWGPC